MTAPGAKPEQAVIVTSKPCSEVPISGSSVRCWGDRVGQGVLDVESHCQADFASRMIVIAAWGSGTVIVTLRPLCMASLRAGPFRTVK